MNLRSLAKRAVALLPPFLGRSVNAYRRRRWRRNFAMQYYRPELERLARWVRQDTEDTNFYYAVTPLNRLHLAHMVSIVAGAAVETVLSLFAEIEEDAALRAHLEVGSKTHIGRDTRVAYGRRIGWYALARLLKPRVVIETGVDHGIGACMLSSALLRNAAEGTPGRYFGTEIRREAGFLLAGAYAQVGTVLYGDSIQSLAQFAEPIDLFINDSDHSADYEYREYKTIAPKLGPHAVILGDNCHGSDSLPRFSRETGRPFLFFAEEPAEHWYPGAGIGFSLPPHWAFNALRS